MDERVAVVGLGRIGLPLALSFADRGLRTIGIERQTAVLDQVSRRADAVQRNGHAGSTRARASSRPAGAHTARSGCRARRPHSADAAHAVACPHRDRHLASARRDRRPAARAAGGPLADLALHGRARHHRVGGGLHRAATRLPGRRGPLHLTRARAHRREPLPGGDRHIAVHHRRRRRKLRHEGGGAVRDLRHRDRPYDPGSGRAGEDLDEHPALFAVRASQPLDDGVRAVRRERIST